MKKIYWLLPLIFILVGGMFTACRTPEPTPTVVPTSTVTSTVTNTATFTATPTMTVTPTPTLTATSTATASVTPVPENASLPTLTLIPEIQPYYDLFTNDDSLGSLYPDSVEIVRNQEDMVLAVNLSMGFALGIPTDMIMVKEVDTENMLASYQGYSFSEPRLRLFAVQIVLMDRGKEPPLQDVVDFSKDQAVNDLIGPRRIIESGQETVTINGVDGEFLYYLTTDGEKAGFYNFLIMIEEYSTDQTLLAYYSLIEGELSEYDARQKMAIARELMIASHQQLVKENVAKGLLNQHAYDIITGLCPTDTDETFGYTKENPIKVAAFPIQDDMAKVFTGPLAEKQYLESLLFDGQQIEFVRRGSIDGEDGILDIYEVTGPGIKGSVSLYLDMYNHTPYRVPFGFGCTGLLHTDQILDFYESGN